MAVSMFGHIDGWMNGQLNGQTGGRRDRQLDGRMDGWKDEDAHMYGVLTVCSLHCDQKPGWTWYAMTSKTL